MEFKLNKIDTDLRQKINDATREGKVHSKKDLVIQKQENRKGKDEQMDFARQLKKYKKNNKNLTVKAEKIDEVQVDVYLEKDPRTSIKRGLLLDTRK
jgi:hypothetical protein